MMVTAEMKMVVVYLWRRYDVIDSSGGAGAMIVVVGERRVERVYTYPWEGEEEEAESGCWW